MAMFALACMSLYFMMGPGGMVSFGHAAFFGGGAYAAALLTHYVHTPMELALFLAPICMGLLALIIGWFCVRLSGVYLAMLTLAFAQICWSIVFQWDTRHLACQMGKQRGGVLLSDDGDIDRRHPASAFFAFYPFRLHHACMPGFPAPGWIHRN